MGATDVSAAARALDPRNAEARALWHIGCPICGKQFEMRRRVGTKPHTCQSKWCVEIYRYQRRFGRWPPERWLVWFAVQNDLLRLPKKLRKQLPLSGPEKKGAA